MADRTPTQRLFAWRIPRRIVTIGIVLLITVLMIGLAPLLLVAGTIADATSGWKRHRWLRLQAMVTLYCLNELFGLLGLGLIWVGTGFGWKVHSPLSYRAHGWLHGAWTHNLLWGIDKVLGARLDIRNREAVTPAPVAILSRHISFLDAVIPSVLIAWRKRNAPRHVLMQELRWEPCIDILGHRTPNHFVDRAAGGQIELEAIRRVGRSADEHGSLIIFPEGGFRTPRRFERAIERLRESQPSLADRAAALRHVLPPRPAGSLALLRGAEDVDIVVVAHAGFENFTSMKKIFANVPLEKGVAVECHRVPRRDVPDEPEAFHDWLLGWYEWIDAFAEHHLDPDATGESPAPPHATNAPRSGAVSTGTTDEPMIELRDPGLAGNHNGHGHTESASRARAAS